MLRKNEIEIEEWQGERTLHLYKESYCHLQGSESDSKMDKSITDTHIEGNR